jgi:glucosamine kinase
VTVLAVDAGRTTCRVGVFSRAGRGAAVSLDSGATLADSEGPARLAMLIETSVRALDDPAARAPESVVVGAAGALSRSDAAAALADAVAPMFAGATEIVVTSDVVAAHSGALDGAAGVVVAVGTGAVAFAVDAGGRTTLVDGAGYLVGDAGSGFAVGRAGLSAALRHHDGRTGGSAALAAAARREFGPLADLVGGLHARPDPARAVARFAPVVAEVARAGDEAAATIWRDAVTELAETVSAACAALPEGDQRVAVTGSLFDLEDLVTEPLRAQVAARRPRAVLRRATGDSLLGASRLAYGSVGVYESLLLRRPASKPAVRGHFGLEPRVLPDVKEA